ncbi:uncharacterized protein LOC124909563 [Impatiens glandulifera]|uniref:uncharacterized protein LOC124909563 n=1 Tax=Impatiens glandulifera TaxID=253017 RepID=UPI001FB17F95|nr:uncharacterized protein LOC124909563 [Impatiens glandulifera]
MLDEVDEQKDRMALAAIYQALPKDVLLMVAEKDSSKLAWEILKIMHVGVERVKEAKVQTLKTQFKAIRMKNDGDNRDTKPRKDKSIVKCYAYQKYKHYASECLNKRPNNEANLTSLHDENPSLIFSKDVTNALPKDEDTNLEELVQESSKEELEVVFLNEEKVMVNILANGDEYNHTNVWYLDNEASNHMKGHREKFNELNKKITRNVKFGDGSLVEIKGLGSILFEYKNGDQHIMTKVEKSSNRLYKISLETRQHVYLLTSLIDPACLWHARLWNVNFYVLKMMGRRRWL